jgi:hypothetical protein
MKLILKHVFLKKTKLISKSDKLFGIWLEGLISSFRSPLSFGQIFSTRDAEECSVSRIAFIFWQVLRYAWRVPRFLAFLACEHLMSLPILIALRTPIFFIPGRSGSVRGLSEMNVHVFLLSWFLLVTVVTFALRYIYSYLDTVNDLLRLAVIVPFVVKF